MDLVLAILALLVSCMALAMVLQFRSGAARAERDARAAARETAEARSEINALEREFAELRERADQTRRQLNEKVEQARRDLVEVRASVAGPLPPPLPAPAPRSNSRSLDELREQLRSGRAQAASDDDGI